MEKAEKTKESWEERKTKIKHKWAVPFIFAEWLCERISYLLEQWAFLDILGQAGRLTILVAVIFYFAESDGRRKAKHYQAWQVINSAQGKVGSGGRIDALQDLNEDKVSLTGVDISKAYIPEINLTRADLHHANLTGADLNNADLTGAFLSSADLTGAKVYAVNFSGAMLFAATLTDADLSGADLTEANVMAVNLSEANLTNTNFTRANLVAANLGGANLTRADLKLANLTRANLKGANLKDIYGWEEIRSIELANIYDVKNPPDGFIEWAKQHGAVSIESDKEWKEFIQKKMEEKKKKETDNRRED